LLAFANSSNEFGILSWGDDFDTRTIEQSHSSQLTTVALTPDESTILTGSGDHTVKVWRTDYVASENLDRQSPSKEAVRHFGAVNRIVPVGDTDYFLSGAWDYSAKLWSARTGALVRNLYVDSAFRAPVGGTTVVAATPDGAVLIAGSARGRVRAWRTTSGDELFNWSLGIEAKVRCVVTSPLGEWLVGAFDARVEDGCCLFIRSLKTGEGGTAYSLGKYQVVGIGRVNREVETLAWIPRLKGIVFVSNRGEVGICEISDKPRLGLTETRVGTSDRVRAKVVAADNDRALLLIDRGELWVVSFREVHPFVNMVCRIPEATCASCNALGSHCLVGTADGRMLWVDVRSEYIAATIAAHSGAINDIVVASDGLAITCSNDQTVKCWDTGKWKEIARFQGESAIATCAYSSRQSVIAAGEGSGRFHVLRLDRLPAYA
jgi:WD40 repeat protein